MTLLSEISLLISFQWKVYGTCWLRCSKWLLGRWFDSFTMTWDADWSSESNEHAPFVSMTLWSRVMFNWKAGSMKGGPFMGRPTPLKVNGANLVPSCPPGVQLLTPFWGMVLQSLPASSNVAKFHISVKSTLWATRHQIFFAMLSQWGKFGTLLPPRGATFTPFWGVVLQSLPASSNVANFNSVKSTLWATRRQSFSPC